MRVLSLLISVVALGVPTLVAQQAQPPAAAPTAAPAATPSPAQLLGLSVYAAKQQPKEQQMKDETECLAWAEQQAGIKIPPPPAADTGAEAKKKKGLRGRRDTKEAKKAAQQEEAQRQQQLTTLKKPMASCLQGREYTVN